MATITKQIVSINAGELIVTFDYNDVSMEVLSIKVMNNSERDYTVSATSNATGKNYTLIVSPGEITQNIPPGQINRLQLSVTPTRRLDGVEWSIS